MMSPSGFPIVNREAMRRWAIQMAGTVKVVSPPELVEEIRETAGTVKVVSPPELVEEIRETIRKMAAEYQV